MRISNLNFNLELKKIDPKNRREIVIKTSCAFPVAAALLSAAMCPAIAGWAEKPIAPGQQDSDQQKLAAEQKQKVMFALSMPDSDSAEGQAAQQKVMLEVVAANAEVVKGKPYSADRSTETVQTLADGNRIVHRTVSKFYRDSEGRTRRDQTFGNVDPEHPSPHEVKVFVDDPVSGTDFVLDPSSKSADVEKLARKVFDEHNAQDDATRIMFKSVKDTETAPEAGPGPMLIKFRDEHSGDPGAVVIQDMNEKRDVAKEDLGTRSIDGVDCNGTRYTTTIPAGEVGNENPISIVTETWYSPAIAAVVQSTTDDPRYGKTTYQLSNLQLTEPPQSLFAPPANFKVNTRK